MDYYCELSIEPTAELPLPLDWEFHSYSYRNTSFADPCVSIERYEIDMVDGKILMVGLPSRLHSAGLVRRSHW